MYYLVIIDEISRYSKWIQYASDIFETIKLYEYIILIERGEI